MTGRAHSQASRKRVPAFTLRIEDVALKGTCPAPRDEFPPAAPEDRAGARSLAAAAGTAVTAERWTPGCREPSDTLFQQKNALLPLHVSHFSQTAL